MKLQEYLRSGKTIQDVEKLGVKIKYHEDGRTLFKYDQIKGDFDNPIVCECRGVILDRLNNWGIVSYPFDKFWNHNEGRVAEIDWDTAKVIEKIDGTCIQLYNWKGAWCVGTLGAIEAEGSTSKTTTKTFAELFWEIWGENFHDLSCLREDYNYMFELATEENRVITDYDLDRLDIIGIRDRETQKEVSPYDYHPVYLPFHRPADYPDFADMKDIVDWAKLLPGLKEGYVVIDDSFNRIKVKNPKWQAAAKLKQSIESAPHNIIPFILDNDRSILEFMPECKDEFDLLYPRMEYACLQISRRFKKMYDNGINDRKSFAITVNRYPFAGAYFQLLDGKIEVALHYLRSINIKKVYEALLGDYE